MLGQTINLRDRMVRKLTSLLQDEIATIFARFRAPSYGFQYVWEANTKLQILQLVHQLLSEGICNDYDYCITERSMTFNG